MRYTIRTDEPYSVSFLEDDIEKSIVQNLSLLFATRKGTIPMYRDFGLAQEFLDKPMTVARVLLLSEVTDAVSTYEPRAKVIDVHIEGGIDGKIVIIVEVEI